MSRRRFANRQQRRRSARRARRTPTARSSFVPRRRGINRWLIVLGVVAVVAIAAARVLPQTADAPGEPAVTHPVPGALPAAVVRIIDGDTLDVRVEGDLERVRLFGIDAPEAGEACADEATSRLEALAGDTVQLLPDERTEDRFGRLLRYVYASDATFIDEALVAEGLALAWQADGAFRDELVEAEERAREGGVGCLWSE